MIFLKYILWMMNFTELNYRNNAYLVMIFLLFGSRSVYRLPFGFGPFPTIPKLVCR